MRVLLLGFLLILGLREIILGVTEQRIIAWYMEAFYLENRDNVERMKKDEKWWKLSIIESFMGTSQIAHTWTIESHPHPLNQQHLKLGVGVNTPFWGVYLQIKKKVFYSSAILYEKTESEETNQKVIFGGLPAFFVHQNFAKIANLKKKIEILPQNGTPRDPRFCQNFQKKPSRSRILRKKRHFVWYFM